MDGLGQAEGILDRTEVSQQGHLEDSGPWCRDWQRGDRLKDDPGMGAEVGGKLLHAQGLQDDEAGGAARRSPGTRSGVPSPKAKD
jgi:hypothetical protein